MPKFESKLSAFGKQRFDQTSTQLRPIPNPRHRHISVAWVTTPVAAIAGVLFGLSIQNNILEPNTKAEEAIGVKDGNAIELPEYCCYNQQHAVALPEFEYIVKQL